MPRRGVQHMRHNVGRKAIAGIEFPVKQEVKGHLRVLGHQLLQHLKAEAADAFEPVAREQKTGIDSDVQRRNLEM